MNTCVSISQGISINKWKLYHSRISYLPAKLKLNKIETKQSKKSEPEQEGIVTVSF